MFNIAHGEIAWIVDMENMIIFDLIFDKEFTDLKSYWKGMNLETLKILWKFWFSFFFFFLKLPRYKLCVRF